MNKCPKCGAASFSRTTDPTTVNVDGHTFSDRLASLVCDTCGELYTDGPALERFELRAAAKFARGAVVSGPVLRFMRHTLALRAADLANLLGVTPETVSNWETGKIAPPRSAVATIGHLILDKLEGRTTTEEQLAAIRDGIPVAAFVDLSAE